MYMPLVMYPASKCPLQSSAKPAKVKVGYCEPHIDYERLHLALDYSGVIVPFTAKHILTMSDYTWN